MAAHAIGSGTISFGLVSVPVKLFSATRSKSVSFNLLHAKDKSRLRQQYTCAACHDVVERSAMVKGYEFSKDQYVVLTDDEIKALDQKSDQSIEIERFVPLDSVDPVYFEKSYLLGPDKGGAKAYTLLAQAMAKSKQAAVARFSTRGQQQLVILRQAEDGLMLHALHYSDEVRSFDDVERGDAVATKAGELDLAVQLIGQLASERFEPEQYKDDYRERVLGLIEKKVAGEEIVAAPQQPAKVQIVDLMEALKASLAAKQEEPTAPMRKAAKPRSLAAVPKRANAKGR